MKERSVQAGDDRKGKRALKRSLPAFDIYARLPTGSLMPPIGTLDKGVGRLHHNNANVRILCGEKL